MTSARPTTVQRVKRLATVVVLLFAAALVAVVAWVSAEAQLGADDSATATPVPGIPSRPPEAFALTVDYVFDGDTIEARAQTPNDVVTTADPIRVRLIGIDTPAGTPTLECWADEARLHLAQLLPEGSTVWAAPDADSWDDYGRRLFNLWTDEGVFVNHALVAAGDAEAIRVWPNVGFYDLLTAAQAEAEASGAGQWGACG